MNRSNVNSQLFGELGSWRIDGYAYAQPLIVDNACGVSSALVTASMNDTIYCFDADHPGTPARWSRHVNSPRTVYNESGGPFNYGAPIGCMATPVVNVPLAVVYASCADNAGLWRLYSFNLLDGSDYRPPVLISGTSRGLTFENVNHLQRAALLLSRNNVYIAFASYDDGLPYQGWVFAYDATNLTQTGVFCAANTANGAGGIWMSGGGISANDAGHVFLVTGNGDWDGTSNFGESFLELDATLNLVSYFTPANLEALNTSDIDLGTTRALLVGSSVISSGKDSRVWVLNQGALGGLQGRDAGQAQVFAGSSGGEFGGMVFANNRLFTSTNGDAIFAYPWDGVQFGATDVQSYPLTFGYPGATCAYSSNGAATATGLLWCTSVLTKGRSANIAPRQGILRVFNATTLEEIAEWTTGTYAKFAEPTVTNGKVYIPTFDGIIRVFGITAAAPNVTAQFSITPSVATLNRATLRYRQTVRLVNNGAAVSSAALLPDNLLAGVALYLPDGTTVAAAPSGRAYKELGAIGAGETIDFVLEFTRTGTAAITWSPQILGTGPR